MADREAKTECARMNNHASLTKGTRMNMNTFGKRVVVAAGFFFLPVMAQLNRAESTPPSAEQSPRTTSPVIRPKKVTAPPDDFAGLTFTAEQKAKMEEIRKDMKRRTDAVVKDEKLTSEQKGAMLDGYRRMERIQLYRVLTPEQQLEVRKRVAARRAAERDANQKKQQSQP